MLLFAALAAVVLAPSGTHARGLLQAQVGCGPRWHEC
jgi:hypothetical protein